MLTSVADVSGPVTPFFPRRVVLAQPVARRVLDHARDDVVMRYRNCLHVNNTLSDLVPRKNS